MYSGKRNTERYSFKDPKIHELISLIPEIECYADFRKKYGSIIPLMKLKMKEGILSTLVQFYDLMYHFFTYPICFSYKYMNYPIHFLKLE